MLITYICPWPVRLSMKTKKRGLLNAPFRHKAASKCRAQAIASSTDLAPK